MILPASAMPVIQQSLPLDIVAGATAAWSVARKLRTAYTGDCIEVRKSDNSLWVSSGQNIGFTPDNFVNLSAISSFFGSFTSTQFGRVQRIYDQATNYNVSNLTSNANIVPIIASQAFPLFTFFNGTLTFNGGSSTFLSFTALPLTGDFTVIIVALATNTNGSVLGGNETANGHANTSFDHQTTGARFQDRNGSYSETASYPPPAIKTITYQRSGTTKMIRVNGVTRTISEITQTRNTTISEVLRRRTGAATYAHFEGFVGEMYVFSNALSASEYQFLENNCMATFGAS